MKSFKYYIIAPLFLWILIVGGTYISDQGKIDSCLDAGKVFDYAHFRCVSHDVDKNIPYLKARYARFAGVSIAVLVFVGAITIFYIIQELRKHS